MALKALRAFKDFKMPEAYKDICFNQIRPKLSALFKKIPDSQLTYVILIFHARDTTLVDIVSLGSNHI